MNYEKLYKEAEQRAIKASLGGFLDAVPVKEIFPELRESSEEMVKRTIISTLYRDDYLSTEEVNECVDWLETHKYVKDKMYWKEEEIDPIIKDYICGKENYHGMITRLRCLKPKQDWNEEDERIRKWIINEIKIKHHNLDEDNVDFVDKAIAWLEKQGNVIKALSTENECKG